MSIVVIGRRLRARYARAATSSPLLIVLVYLVVVVVFSSCAEIESRKPPRPPMPTPVPSLELRELPRDALMQCRNNPNLDRDTINLWEYPGTEPTDPNSAYMGNRGERLGELTPCTPIVVTEFAWSETDRKFWVRIRGPNGEEGWVALNLLTFGQPSPKAP